VIYIYWNVDEGFGNEIWSEKEIDIVVHFEVGNPR
jgi:hypothetical protein